MARIRSSWPANRTGTNLRSFVPRRWKGSPARSSCRVDAAVSVAVTRGKIREQMGKCPETVLVSDASSPAAWSVDQRRKLARCYMAFDDILLDNCMISPYKDWNIRSAEKFCTCCKPWFHVFRDPFDSNLENIRYLLN